MQYLLTSPSLTFLYYFQHHCCLSETCGRKRKELKERGFFFLIYRVGDIRDGSISNHLNFGFMCNKDYHSTVNAMKTNDGTVWYDREMSNTAGGHTYKYILPFLAPPSSGGICFSEPDILKSAGQQGCHCPDHSSAATSTAAITQEMLPRVSTHQTATRSHLQSVRNFLQSEDYSVIAGLDESARGLERWQIGWSSAQSRPLRAESCEATCICCNSCHLWTCWTPSITVSLCCLSEVETEHQGTKQTGLDIRKYFITQEVSQSWNRSLRQLYKPHPWMFLGFIWMKPEVLILNWCPSFFEWKAGLYDLLR